MQTRGARLALLAVFGLASAGVAALVALIVATLVYRELSLPVLDPALGWGGLALAFASGAIAYSQNTLGRGESSMRARLGESYRPPPLPLAQILIPLIGAGVLILAHLLITR